MKATIYEYHLAVSPEVQYVLMPKGSRVLHVGVQDHLPTIWTMGCTSEPREQRWFLTVPTGVDFDDHGLTYCGTIQLHVLVWHIFEYRGD